MKPEIANQIKKIYVNFIAQNYQYLLESMKTGVNRIHNISKYLRIFSLFDYEHKTTFNLSEGIDSTLFLSSKSQRTPSGNFIKNYGILPLIQCYPGQLNQVFMKILANAIDVLEKKFEQDACQAVDKKFQQINIITEAQGETAIVKIYDNGKGMSQKVKERIFEQ